MNPHQGDPLPTSLLFILRWSSSGLTVFRAPGPMDGYPLPSALQRSLRTPSHDAAPREPVEGTKDLIPFGVVANMLHRAGWCNLSVSFEPGPDRKLRLFFSVDDLRLTNLTEPLQVTLFGPGGPLSSDLFRRGTYHSPSLLPGEYLFEICSGKDNSLTEIRLILQDSLIPDLGE